jgi:hypothetical protein
MPATTRATTAALVRRLLVLGLGLGLLGAALPTPAVAVAPPADPQPAAHTRVAAGSQHHHRRRGKVIMPLRRAGGVAPGTASVPMSYHGGPLMTSTARVYLIWYGDWSASPAPRLLTDLVRSFGGSRYASTNATFTDGAGRHVTTDVRFGGSTTVAAARSARLSDAGVRQVLRRAVTTGALPNDADGIYVVATSADVRETSGFGRRYCGWHTHTGIAGQDLKLAFVGDPSTQAPHTCAPPVTITPNGDLGADAMASTLVHEIDETLTDPDLDGWYDRYLNENADKCAWTYGVTYPTGNGASANVRLGGHDFLLQRTWVATPQQGCALSG